MVAKEGAKGEAKISALGAGKAQPQRVCEEETARAREEAKRRPAEATAAAMEEAAKKIKREMPPGGSRMDTF